MSLGFKGGYSLSQTGFSTEVVVVLTIGVFLSFFLAALGYAYFKTKTSPSNAAAIGATYGSVSAVTFITATQYLINASIEYGEYMSAVLAVMEAPAIIICLFLLRAKPGEGTSSIIGESFKDGAPLLLLACMFIAYIGGDNAYESLASFNFDLFRGILALFLLDMGLTAARSYKELDKSKEILLYAIIAPLLHSLLALLICWGFNISLGNTILMMTLTASASYIAVPAVMKTALPEVPPALYIGMGLGITFPFNIIIGIPLYTEIAKFVYGV